MRKFKPDDLFGVYIIIFLFLTIKASGGILYASVLVIGFIFILILQKIDNKRQRKKSIENKDINDQEKTKPESKMKTININSASNLEFAQVSFLSVGKIKEILEYRERVGKFISTEEFINIVGRNIEEFEQVGFKLTI